MTKRRYKMLLIRFIAFRMCEICKETRRIWYACIQAEQELEDKLCIMCHNETSCSCQPLLPKRWNSLFDNEAGSDVVFLVGSEPDTWRFPGHRSILLNNPVFRAMLEGPFATGEQKIVIQDVEGRAFDLLLRYFYHEDIQLQSVSTALSTLYAANKYLCPELVDICVRYLDEHITIDTVLHIYQHLRYFSEDLSGEAGNDPIGLPSAPPQSDVEETQPLLSAGENGEGCGNSMSQCCTWLLFNCYHFIDSHADEVFNEECIEDLTRDALYDLTRRDYLGISSELILFNVIEKWCNRECKRCQLELSENNRKSILGERLLFSVRYLLMSSEEFLSGPMCSGLFDQIEAAILLGYILQQPVNIVSNRLTPQLLEILRQARIREIYSPIPLSMRTKQKVTNESKSLVSIKLVSKKEKKKKEKKRASESKCFNYTLNVLASIFD